MSMTGKFMFDEPYYQLIEGAYKNVFNYYSSKYTIAYNKCDIIIRRVYINEFMYDRGGVLQYLTYKIIRRNIGLTYRY